MLKLNEEQIDTNLYSRQIATLGLETMFKLIKLKVLIVGVRGLGAETAKNLIMTGPASVALFDPTIVSLNDLGANFCLSESQVGKLSRAAGSLNQLKDLNPSVNVSVVEKLTLEDHLNYDVICYTENFEGIDHLI